MFKALSMDFGCGSAITRDTVGRHQSLTRVSITEYSSTTQLSLCFCASYVANQNYRMDQITRMACPVSERTSCACFAWAFSSAPKLPQGKLPRRDCHLNSYISLVPDIACKYYCASKTKFYSYLPASAKTHPTSLIGLAKHLYGKKNIKPGVFSLIDIITKPPICSRHVERAYLCTSIEKQSKSEQRLNTLAT